MSGQGKFGADLNEVGLILSRLNLLDERPLSPNKKLGAADFRGLTYKQLYEKYIKEICYDFKLTDQAIMCFTRTTEPNNQYSLSYSYCECPVAVPTYDDFCAAYLGSSQDNTPDSDLAEAFSDELRFLYEQNLETASFKAGFTPIRYDYKYSDYRPGIHPASHVHFGFANDIRVGTKKVLNPISFLLLIIRQVYPKYWLTLRSQREFSDCSRQVRMHLDDVPTDFFCDDDECEMHLH